MDRNSLPPLNWLRAFEAAARHLSFTGAARDLNMTQSAVSQQVKALEGHLGRPLFYRRARILELTQTGLTYLPVVRDAFRTLSQGTRAITRASGDVLRIQCNLSFAVYWLAPRLPRFQAAHPDVQLYLSTELWEPRDIAEGIDIEIRYSLRPADTVLAELLHRDAYYPVCAPGYAVTLADLTAQPLYDCSNMMGSWAGWAEEQDMDWPQPPITYFTTYSMPLAVALSGGGLALGHDAIAADLIVQGRLVAPFSHRATMQEAYYLIQSAPAQGMASAQVFVTWLRAELAAFQSERLATQA
ncbi:LysR substrate-binding domain-containing protein [Sulfitobacter aestuarii]|uniref:LysR substrate-binding domain-containing protein n=1 Tax=Sulfitobacter aestuarii TaxID=2161676 RepID=A0ABW5TXG5_9RHOB